MDEQDGMGVTGGVGGNGDWVVDTLGGHEAPSQEERDTWPLDSLKVDETCQQVVLPVRCGLGACRDREEEGEEDKEPQVGTCQALEASEVGVTVGVDACIVA